MRGGPYRRTTICGVLNRFTSEARSVVSLAQREAREAGLECVTTLHLLQALVEIEDTIAAEILASHGLDRSSLAQEMSSGIHGRELEGSQDEHFTGEALTVLQTSPRQALAMGQNDVEPEHILLALASVPAGAAGRLLAERGLNVPGARVLLAAVAEARRDSYFESLPLEISRDLRRVLVAMIGHAQSSGAARIDLSDLMLALSRDREIPLLRQAAFEEAALLGPSHREPGTPA